MPSERAMKKAEEIAWDLIINAAGDFGDDDVANLIRDIATALDEAYGTPTIEIDSEKQAIIAQVITDAMASMDPEEFERFVRGEVSKPTLPTEEEIKEAAGKLEGMSLSAFKMGAYWAVSRK